MVWGSAGFQTGLPLVGAVIDAEGRPCAVDAEGVSCFDDDGEEAWGLELPGVDIEDVVSGDGVWALLGRDETVLIDSGTGAIVDRLGPEVSLVRAVGGEALAFDGRTVNLLVADEVRSFPIPTDIEALDLLVDGERAGVIDGGGGLTWFDADGNEVAYLDLDLAVDGGVRTLPLADGWALIDDEGVVVLGLDGQIRAEADVGAEDLVFAEGELWLATDEGVLPMDPATGELGEALVDGRLAGLAATDDGEVLAVLDVGGRRLRSWLDDEALHGGGHAAGVMRLSPLPGGGLVSVDGEGWAIRWSATGAPAGVGEDLDDAVVDGAGGLWLGRLGGLERVVADGSGKGELGVVAMRLVALPDGVLVGDGGSSVSRRSATGEVIWTSDDLAHNDGLGVAGDLVVGLDGGVVEVADLATGSPRRRLARPGESLLAAGVAVGGLVVVGEREGVVGAWRPPRRRAVRGIEGLVERVALAPNGRWGAGVGPDGDVVVFETQGGVLHRGEPGAAVASLAVDERHVWLGRDDGRIERWTLAPLVVDAPLPHFDPWAQLEGFVAPPPGPGPVEETRRGGGVVDLAGRPDGALAVSAGSLDATLPATGGGATRWVPVLAEPRVHTVVHWDPELALVVGTQEGRLLSIDGTKERTLARTKGAVTALCALPDSLLVATSAGMVELVGRKLRRVPGAPERPVGGLACDPEGRWALAVQDGAAVAWSLVTGEVLARPVQGAPIRSVAVLPDGTALTGGEDRTVTLWDPVRWQVQAVLEGHGGAVVDLAVDPDGRRLVAGSGAGAVVWDLVPLVPVARLATGEAVSAVAIDGSGERVWLGTTQGGVLRFALPAPAGEPVVDDTDAPEIIEDIPPPVIKPGALDGLPPDER